MSSTRAVAGLLLALALPANADDADGARWHLRGLWQQGCVLVGQAPTGTRVWFNGRKLAVNAAGEFVFGLDRDAPEHATLKLQLPSDKQPHENRYDVARREYQIQRLEGLPPGQVNPPASAMPRIKREQALLNIARKRDSALDGFAQAMQWPALGRVSGVFGSQRILNGVPKAPHAGVDVAVPIGTPVAAPADGVVSLAEPNFYFTGGTLMIDHGHGLQSMLIHLSKLKVKPGEVVKQGQIVAESGMTGRATGPHLHWAMYWFDSRVDAQTLVPPMPVAQTP